MTDLDASSTMVHAGRGSRGHQKRKEKKRLCLSAFKFNKKPSVVVRCPGRGHYRDK